MVSEQYVGLGGGGFATRQMRIRFKKVDRFLASSRIFQPTSAKPLFRHFDVRSVQGYRGDLIPPLDRRVSVLLQTQGLDFCSPGSKAQTVCRVETCGEPESLVLCFLYYYSGVQFLPLGVLIEMLLPVIFGAKMAGFKGVK